jgi:hypothetical protein
LPDNPELSVIVEPCRTRNRSGEGKVGNMDQLFTRIATKSANIMGRPSAFLIATACCVLWAITGPVFHYSDTWQLGTHINVSLALMSAW